MTWLWYRLFSFRVAPDGVDIGSLLFPYSGWHQSLCLSRLTGEVQHQGCLLGWSLGKLVN